MRIPKINDESLGFLILPPHFPQQYSMILIVLKVLVQSNNLVQKLNIVHQIQVVVNHRMKPLFINNQINLKQKKNNSYNFNIHI
jgi:hypothetical protein